MPKAVDPRIPIGKKNRNEKIEKKFSEMSKKGFRYDYIINEIILETGLSESTISKIISGKY